MFKDLFISYGRRESLGYVGKLHRALKMKGFDGWFDKVNIPDGEDYALRIANGIENAQNFIYIMAPRCMKSPYCLIELEQARFYGKRVIPINQLAIFDCEPKPLSEGDKAVMTGFYKAFGLPDQNIQTEQDVLKRSHLMLGRSDWIYSREEFTDADAVALFNWQEKYEGFWRKHDDLDYLIANPIPLFGKEVDPFNNVVDALIILINKHKEYIYRHTVLLYNVIEWRNHQKSTNFLLVGNERKEAEAWLLREFKAPDQPPCVPSQWHIELITESRKNAENLYTDVFLSYSRKNTEACVRLNNGLMRFNVTTWVDLFDIEKGGLYVEAIYEAIEKSAHFAFLMSEKSLNSEYCLRELRFAIQLNKHVIPIKIDKFDASILPSEIAALQYIDFTDNEKDADFVKDIDDILISLHSEKAYYEQHRTYYVQAKRWKKSNKSNAFLLHGFNLENALNWLRLHENRSNYAPIPIHREFIGQSRAMQGQLTTEVFVSYSRKDGDFARKINLALQQSGKSTWFDQESITEGSNFDTEIFKGIQRSQNFLFIISPNSVNSEFCEKELIYAAEQGKRFVPILLELSSEYMGKLPETYANTQWTDFKNNAFNLAFQRLIGLLETDRDHIQAHTKWQTRAIEWDENAQTADYLLNVLAYKNAVLWQNESLEKKKNPAPTPLQLSFFGQSGGAIEAAEKAENDRQTKELALVNDKIKAQQKAAKRQRIFMVFIGFLLFCAAGIAYLAYNQSVEADKNALKATKSLQRVQLKEIHERIQRLNALLAANENAVPIIKEVKEIINDLPEKDALEKFLFKEIKTKLDKMPPNEQDSLKKIFLSLQILDKQ